ncbi:hypothetical protein B5807_08046 [Epicoccum nigrum]|uniref:Uncharacterized protein n=1 Tax=Epicoccum nigrum TaxID=105696 RepID=A0A1Y2LPZ5_EPING|nr:hypothetical protein B5807_08046 [Epicoccum nigrum]
MRPPTIHVQDADRDLTLRYVHGKNELDLKAIYTTVSSLHNHPGRDRLDYRGMAVGCSDTFLDSFWSVAASLLDYFADFYATDTAMMQSLWFHILDEWQRACPTPTPILDSPLYRTINPTAFSMEDYKRALEIMNRLINPGLRPEEKDPGGPVIHNPSGTVQGLAGAHETGPFISGLKPWQQFLCSGAPGHKPASPETTPPAASEGLSTNLAAANEGPSTSLAAANEDPPTRYIPQPGIALIQTHTARARRLLEKLKEKQNRDSAAALAAFDALTVSPPSALHHTLTRPSLTQADKTLSYQLVQGAPPVKRHEGLTDPSMLIEKPDLVLLDEAVGVYKGREAYVPMTGPVTQEGVGFDVWAVKEKDGLGLGSGAVDGRKKALAAAMENMFDDWEFPNERP